MGTPDGVTARRTNRSSAQVRQGLLDAGARLVRERGVAAVTYRDIAAEAGASDSVLLRHFGSKNELINEAVIEPFTASLEELARRRGGGSTEQSDPIAARSAYLVELHGILSGNRSLVRAMLAAEASGADDPVLVPALARLRGVLTALTGTGAGAEADLTARVVMAMTVAVVALDDVLFPSPVGPPSRDALVTALARLTTHGRAGAG